MSDCISNLILFVLYLAFVILGNPVCTFILKNRKIINTTKLAPNLIPSQNEAGRVIGVLERLIIGLGILLKSWELVVGVVALKSIARYKELDKQINAEYFLAGSMISILWAFVATFGLIILGNYLNDKHIVDSTFINYIQSFAASKN